MKNTFVYILTFILFFIAFVLYRNIKTYFPRSKTKILMSDSIIDIGTLFVKNLDTIIKRDFVLYNVGQNDLYIYKIQPDCKCTGLSNIKLNTPISPNDSTVISLLFSPKLHGLFQVTSTIELNVDTSPTFTLRGNIIEP